MVMPIDTNPKCPTLAQPTPLRHTAVINFDTSFVKILNQADWDGGATPFKHDLGNMGIATDFGVKFPGHRNFLAELLMDEWLWGGAARKPLV